MHKIFCIGILSMLFLGVMAPITVQAISEQDKQLINVVDEIINVTKNEVFSIDLRSNPTTGYTWEVKFDPTYVQMIDRTYKPDTSDPRWVGGGGTDTFVFRGIKSGETEIEFSYLRPWDRLTPPVVIKVFKIKIE